MSRKNIWIGALLLAIAGFFIYLNKPADKKSDNSTPVETKIQNTPMDTTINNSTDSGKLIIEDLKVGDGREAKIGDTVVMNYIGTLVDGTKFDSSYDRNQPFTTQIGVGQVIKGWDEGVPGMKIGGKRKLTIPPDLGYGSTGAGAAIPPNATLIFEVELLDIK